MLVQTFACKSCNEKFFARLNVSVIQCPYCGHSGVRRIEEATNYFDGDESYISLFQDIGNLTVNDVAKWMYERFSKKHGL